MDHRPSAPSRPRRNASVLAWHTAAVLLLAGAVATLVLSRLSIDATDWKENALVYLAAIPIGITLIGMISRPFLSARAETGAQTAFLMSLAIHLLLLHGAWDLVVLRRAAVAEPAAAPSEDASERRRYSHVSYEPAASNPLGQSARATDITRSAIETPDAAAPTPVEPRQLETVDSPAGEGDLRPELATDVSLRAAELASVHRDADAVELDAAVAQLQRQATARPTEVASGPIAVDAGSFDELAMPADIIPRSLSTDSPQPVQPASSLSAAAELAGPAVGYEPQARSQREGQGVADRIAAVQSAAAAAERQQRLDRGLEATADPVSRLRRAGGAVDEPTASLAAGPVPNLPGQTLDSIASDDAKNLQLRQDDVAMSPRPLGAPYQTPENSGGRSTSNGQSGGALAGPRDLDLAGPRLGSRSADAATALAPPRLDDLLASAGPVLDTPAARPLPRSAVASVAPGGPAVPTAAFARRSLRNREAAAASDIGRWGPQTETAIEEGLRFLAQYQRRDGSWQLEQFGEDLLLRSDTAATGLSLLAFQGAGYSHKEFQYQAVCAGAVRWLIDHQKPDGDLYVEMDPASDANARFYSHAIATLALCEAYGMTQDEALARPAQRAIDFLVAAQDPLAGGWRYQVRRGADLSVSGWGMMAIKSAELAGLEVDPLTFQRLTRLLDRAAAGERQQLYRYNPDAPDLPSTRHGLEPTATMTAVGLLMRFYTGWRRGDAPMIAGADHLAQFPPALRRDGRTVRDTYYWYYATQVMFHMGGDYWRRWQGELHPLLIRSQVPAGPLAGSWEPRQPVPDRWGELCGRLYLTTMNLLSLEVYYRHLPLYEETAK